MTKVTIDREERYTVIKHKDLTDDDRSDLGQLIQSRHIPTRKCLVIESDWPEYEPAWRMIEARVTGASTKPATVPEGAAESIAEMVAEWVDGGIRMNTDWRSGLAGIITKRLSRFAAPRQPDGEEIAWSLRSDVAGCGLVRYMTDSKYQAQTQAIKQWYEPFRCQQCTDAQRAIAELRDRLDVMTQCADNYSRMFEESAEECSFLKECQENAMLHMTGLVAERDTLRQQIDEARDEISQHSNDLTIAYMAGAADMRQQCNRLAGLLREVGDWIDRTSFHGTDAVDLMQRIDAALAEIDNGN